MKRISKFTGKPYPPCAICGKTVYADGLCYWHYQTEPSKRQTQPVTAAKTGGVK